MSFCGAYHPLFGEVARRVFLCAAICRRHCPRCHDTLYPPLATVFRGFLGTAEMRLSLENTVFAALSESSTIP